MSEETNTGTQYKPIRSVQAVFQLMDALDRETLPAARILLHAMLAQELDAWGIACPPLSEFGDMT